MHLHRERGTCRERVMRSPGVEKRPLLRRLLTSTATLRCLVDCCGVSCLWQSLVEYHPLGRLDAVVREPEVARVLPPLPLSPPTPSTVPSTPVTLEKPPSTAVPPQKAARVHYAGPSQKLIRFLEDLAQDKLAESIHAKVAEALVSVNSYS